MNSIDLLWQLAQGWHECADADDLDANDRPAIRETFRAYARTRRNCASELLGLLARIQKENPPIGGPLVPETDCESV